MFAMRVIVIGLALVGLAHAAHGAERRPVPLRGSYDPAAPVHRAPVPARAAAPIRAAEPIIVSKDPVPPAAYAPPPLRESYDFHYEIGVRYWYSTGKLAKDLHDDPRFTETLNSRLTYSGLDAHAGEIFGRVAHIDGPFIKGYAGLAGLDAGSLNDEDFPPNTVPYSSTDSDQRGGTLGYVSADIGYAFLAWPWVRLGVFAGYHYLEEKVHAYGCTQVGANPAICGTPVADSVLVISEDAAWHSVRLGLSADVRLSPRLKFSGEAAFVPYTQLNSYDTHWLRLGTGLFDISGRIPEHGTGYGVQLEAVLSYDVSERFSIGAGGRYWYMKTTGETDFENVIVGVTLPAAQPIDFETERYGVFLQGSYRFGT